MGDVLAVCGREPARDGWNTVVVCRSQPADWPRREPTVSVVKMRAGLSVARAGRSRWVGGAGRSI